MTATVFSSFALPCGLTLKNRIVKAAMEENLAADNFLPGQALFTLYERWAQGGAGLIITGNVMVDHQAMTGPGGVALEADTDLAPFQQWAKLAKQNDTKIWMQINHPGRQVYENMQGKALAPSAKALDLGSFSKLFAIPKAMHHADIADVIQRFVTTAKLAEQAGFDGVQIHAAHGYLLSQFLSPLTNLRDDEWGGSLANRARLLANIISQVKAEVSAEFCVAVKLNTADFQRGGFDVDDANAVVAMLETLGVDCIELSGGSYEAPAMQRTTADERTLAREAYFLEFAQAMVKQTTVPLMLTGGIYRFETAQQVLDEGMSLVGMASALGAQPDLPNIWQAQPEHVGRLPNITWSNKPLKGLATMAMVKRWLRENSQGRPATHHASAVWTLLKDQWFKAKQTKRYRQQCQVKRAK